MPQRRLTMRTLLPEDGSVDFTGYPGVPPEWQKELPVRGKLSVEEIGRLFNLEEEISSASRPDQLRVPLERAYAMVMEILRERTPELPNLPLGVEEVMGLMAFLAGAETVQEAVLDSIRGADHDEGAEEGEERSLGAQSVDPQGEGDPLPSAKPSRKRSSRSANASAGDQSGGESAAGEASADMSRTSRAVA
jgi:hypothetical protein